MDRGKRRGPLEAAARRRQPPHDEAEHVVAVAGDRRPTVWVMTGTGVLKAFDFGGKELWARDIQTDYGRFGLQWGYASSPLLYEDSLYVQVLHGMHTDDPSYLLRIDKATGKTVWRVLRRPTRALRVAGRVHDAGAAALRRRPRSSSPAATSSPATTRRRARSCGAPTASTRTTTAATASSPRRSCTAICCSRRRASARCWR